MNTAIEVKLQKKLESKIDTTHIKTIFPTNTIKKIRNICCTYQKT